MMGSFAILMLSRGSMYMIGAFVVALIVFTTAAKTPSPTCPRCREVNRPAARYCAHCGQRLSGR